MDKVVSFERSRALRLAASTVAAAALVAAAGIIAGHANAAGLSAAPKGSRPAKKAKVNRPKLEHGRLTIDGTQRSDKITLRLQARHPGVLQVDVGDDGRADFSFERKHVATIAVFARGGNDRVRVDERNGVFTNKIRTRLDGGAGNDILAGGQGGETLVGGDGNDVVDGKGGSDQVLLGAGDDVFVWDPGDGSDRVEGQAGTDTLRFNGADVAERFDLSANGPRLRLGRDFGNVAMDTAGVERVELNALGGADTLAVGDLSGTGVTSVNANLGVGDGQPDRIIVNGTNGNDNINVNGDASGVVVSGVSAQVAIQHPEPTDELDVNGLAGNDSISAAGLAAGVIALTLDGGAGDDTLAGGPGAETLLGGDGNDSLDGNKGNDRALLGAGDDTFVWDPGDGSDTVEGGDGSDTMRFNGADVAEQFALSANGGRLRLSRDVGNVTMDTAGVERVDVNALGGADTVTVNDLGGTDVTNVNADLGGSDSQPDRIIVNGTNGNDTIKVNGDASGVVVSGLSAQVALQHPEPTDELDVNGLAGNDSISASGLAAGAITLTLDGGVGDDQIFGGQGVETLLGGDGNDSIDGNGGNDKAFLGAGDDTFVWDPGDGSDTIEGQAGADTMLFNGADVAERVSLLANGNRLTFLRAPGAVTMDTAGVERVDFNALGGADVIFVNDLSGTDVKTVNLDLGVGDAQSDRVVVDGTDGDDTINVSGDASAVAVSGLSARVAIQHHEPTDELDVNGLAGNDSISAAGLAAGAITLTLDGGAGDDAIAGGQGVETLLGGDGNDSIDGNGGNDKAFLGAGDDTFVWDPGDGSDTIEGEDGIDTMLFNGAAAAEQVDVSANGSRLKFFRNPGAITMDTAGVEQVDFNALGGADVVTVNDLTGTDVASLNLDLGVGGVGDGQPDRIVVNGTNGDDAVRVFGDAGGVNVKGLVPTIGILHPEAANDRLEINTLAGIDTLDSAGLAAGAIQVFFDGSLVP